jgi:anti-sigma B factor antagonist
MPTANVTMTIRKPRAEASIVDIQGEITGFAESALIDAYTQASSRGTRAIILNFADLDHMNSSGIGLLVTLLVRAHRQKQRLLACGLSEQYQQVFELTRLDEGISIYENEAEALAAVGGQQEA